MGMIFPRHPATTFLAALCAVSLLAGCLAEPEAPAPREEAFVGDGGEIPAFPVIPAGWPAARWPADNPYTPAKALLGRRLFNETLLSVNGVVSCEWCHAQSAAFTDIHTSGFGSGVFQQPIPRTPPTLFNLLFASTLMFEGNVSTLEEQVLFPLFAPHEMGMTGPEIERRLAGDTLYVRLFRQAFGPGPVRMEGVAKALATYLRTLVSSRTPYDRWKAGDSNAISPEAKAGEALFMGKARCFRCHVPPLFTDGDFHNIGLDRVPKDRGRALHTGLPGDEGRLKTPTLRNIVTTSPYMHDGRFQDIESVIERYNEGGYPQAANVDSLIVPLGLTGREIYELAEFLRTLTDP
jgi:cytochrome c peroxidase